MLEIRKARYEDVDEIVRVNTKTWLTAYSGIISDEFLLNLDSNLEARIKRRQEQFLDKSIEDETLVAIYDNKLVGFVNYGKAREDKNIDLDNICEIYAIYVLNDYQGKNIGKKLIRHAVKDLLDYDSLIIWALKDNPSRKFYEALGGVKKYSKTITIGRQELDEVAYLFSDLDKLITTCE